MGWNTHLWAMFGLTFFSLSAHATSFIFETEHDWPMFQHNLAHTGQYPGAKIRTPEVKWQSDVEVLGYLNNPVVVNNTVYVSSQGHIYGQYIEPDDKQGIYAFELKTGQRKWFYQTKHDPNALIYAQNRLVFGTDNALLMALDARNGKGLWQREMPAEIFNCLADRHTLFCGDAQGMFYRIDARKGRTLWKTQLKGAIRAVAAMNQSTLFVATVHGQVSALSIEGQTLWQSDITHAYPGWSDRTDRFPVVVYGAPTLVENKLILSFVRNAAYPQPAMVALAQDTGKTLWWAKDTKQLKSSYANIRSSPAIFEHLAIWAEANSNQVVALDHRTGQVEWVSQAGFETYQQWASPAILGDQVLIPRFDGGLYALNARNGLKQWDFYLGNKNKTGPFPEQIYETFGYTHLNTGDVIYTSPALTPDNGVLIASDGMLYKVGE